MTYLSAFIKIVARTGKNATFSTQINTYRNYVDVCTNRKDMQIQVMDKIINYSKIGCGEKAILLFPGALGSIWTDFQPQMEQFDREKFTIVGFDPPGYGYSRPPNRQFLKTFYKDDAKIAYELMKNLGIEKFSPLGWSDGGISSLILAAEYPKTVEKLVVWGANSYITPQDQEAFETTRDTNKWSKKAREPLTRIYGENNLQNLWDEWCNTMDEIRKDGGNICMNELGSIKCQTLILHGNLDPLVDAEHPAYLNTHIKNSRLHIFPKGKHNIHLRYANEFNSIVTNFLLE